MRILVLSGSDIKGGAAKVAFELARGLNEQGVSCDMLVQKKSGDAPWVTEIQMPERGEQPISRRVIHRLGLNALNLNSPFPRCYGRKFFEQYDLIHLHDLPGHFNFRHLSWLSRLRPTFWTLHTQWAFTGGCLYTYSCERHLQHCGSCPQFGQFPLHWLHRDGSREQNYLKRHVYGRSQLTPICVSTWLAETAKAGMLGRFDVQTVLNPVDTREFFPIPKAEAKKQLGIPEDRRTVMFAVAANPLDLRKGFDIISQALPLLAVKNLFLLPTAISAESDELKEALNGRDCLPPRHLSTNHELRLYYSAADVIWHPTRADTSSMVSLEALACGTPVIAATVGGVTEIVRDEENGLHIPPDSPAALAAATERFFSEDSLRTRLTENAIASVATRHSLDRFIEDHRKIYRQVLKITV